MFTTEFVYTTYTVTTPDRLWQALIDPAFTIRYWGPTFETDWVPGSPVVWSERGATITDPEQVVLEFEPFPRLSYTWHTFTPQLAQAVGVSEEVRARLVKERRPKVTFQIEPVEERVKLTVVHENFDADAYLGAGRGTVHSCVLPRCDSVSGQGSRQRRRGWYGGAWISGSRVPLPGMLLLWVKVMNRSHA